MPRRDQTGPMSEGARTGRGFGPCGEDPAVRAGNNKSRRGPQSNDQERTGTMEFGLRQGNGLKRRGRGRRNDG